MITDGFSNRDLIYDNSSLREELLGTLLFYDNSRVPSDYAMSFQSKLNVTVKVPKYKNLMYNNTFYRNYGGFGDGLIEIKGFTRFYIINDTYLNNGENIVEITNYIRRKYNYFIQSDINTDNTPPLFYFSYEKYMEN